MNQSALFYVFVFCTTSQGCTFKLCSKLCVAHYALSLSLFRVAVAILIQTAWFQIQFSGNEGLAKS